LANLVAESNGKAPFSATRKTKVGIDSVSQPRASDEHPKQVAKLVQNRCVFRKNSAPESQRQPQLFTESNLAVTLGLWSLLTASFCFQS
jgi:hypothetical protein